MYGVLSYFRNLKIVSNLKLENGLVGYYHAKYYAKVCITYIQKNVCCLNEDVFVDFY